MSTLSFFSLAAAVFVLAITPGPGVFATVARGMASGFAPAAFVVVGIVCGDLFFLLLAMYGLAAIAELLGDFFLLIRYLGGGYLIFLGLCLFFTLPRQEETGKKNPPGAGSNFFSGLAITLANPKVILFYLGFLPGFIDLRHLEAISFFSVAATVGLVLGMVLLGYGFLAARTGTLLTGPRTRRSLGRGSGAIMVGIGSSLLFDLRP